MFYFKKSAADVEGSEPCNKMDELTLVVKRNRGFSSSCVLCLTETWLRGPILDCTLQLEGFQLL